MIKLEREFYNRPTLTVAKELVGKVLFCKGVSVRITETEAYIGDIDKACHSYGGKMTERTRVMFGKPGHAYIYIIYGMYNCFNVVTEEEGRNCAVLIRGAMPVKGTEQIIQNRYNRAKEQLTRYQQKNLLNGPGKLCMALNLTREQNGYDLISDDIYIYDDGFHDFTIKTDKRVNIDYAEEAVHFPWRFILEAVI